MAMLDEKYRFLWRVLYIALLETWLYRLPTRDAALGEIIEY